MLSLNQVKIESLIFLYTKVKMKGVYEMNEQRNNKLNEVW